jgi:hypothetical protein
MVPVKAILISLLVTGTSLFGQGLGFTAARQHGAAAAGGGGGSITVVFDAALTGTAGGMTDVDAGDTTAASGMVAIVYTFSSFGADPITDEMGNTWTPLAFFTPPGNYQLRFFHCANFTGNATHTFSSTANFASISLVGVTGHNAGAFFDSPQTNAAGSAAATTLQTGSITPSGDGRLVVTASIISTDANLTVDSGLTLGDATSISSAIGTSFAWKVQNPAAAINPEWSQDGVPTIFTVGVAAFK